MNPSDRLDEIKNSVERPVPHDPEGLRTFARRHLQTLALAVSLALLLGVGGAAVTAAGSFGYKAPESRLVQVTLKVMGVDSAERVYEVYTTTDGSPLELSSGTRVPVATKVGGEGRAKTYEYQDLGFSAILRVTAREDGRLRVEGQLEDSRVAEEPTEEGLPTIEHRTHQFRGLLEANSELEVSSLTDPGVSPFLIAIQVREF